MAYATNGRIQLSAANVRTESGISCIAGTDTRSGGLRAVDVQRVAAAHGVTIDYGPGGLANWPSDELYRRLSSNHAAIVLGDAQDAPVNPTFGVVYHSALVHGLRAGVQGRETHWHDPRLSQGYWVQLGAVDKYQTSMEGVRFAGFVALPLPDTSTGGSVDMVNVKNAGRQQGLAWVRGAGHQLCEVTNTLQRLNVQDGEGPYQIIAELYLVNRAGQPISIEGNVTTTADPRCHVLLLDSAEQARELFGLFVDFRIEWD
jgi:hypothetical protein